MDFSILHAQELPLFYWIRSQDLAWLDQLAVVWNFLDTGTFNLLLIPFIWLVWGRRCGLWFLFALLISSTVNGLLKFLFLSPRPLAYDSALGLVQLYSYGFPSGASQNAVLLPGLLLYFWRSRWSWVVAVPFGLSLALSRIWLGVHFVSDVVAGTLVGGLLLALILWLFPLIERGCFSWWVYQIPGVAWGVLAWVARIPKYGLFCAIALGVLNGVYFFRGHLLPALGWRLFAYAVLIGVGIFLDWLIPLPFVSYGLLGFFMTLPYQRLLSSR